MTLGEYPDKVPPQYLIPLELFRSKVDVGRFENVASLVGLGSRGPNLAGGSIFDDFNGDGLPDLFTTSLDADLGASLFVNRGDGTFEDRSRRGRPRRPGLRPERHPRRLRQRRRPRRPAAPRRLGEAAAALAPAEPGGRRLRRRDRRQRPGRADRDRVGRLGRLRQRRLARPVRLRRVPPARRRPPRPPGATRATAAGSTTTEATARSSTSPPRPASLNERCAKGSAWGDYDGDGRLDLFVSNMGQPCRLYHNEGDGKFRDVAPELGVTGASHQLRLLVLGLRQRRPARPLRQRLPGQVAEVVASAMGVTIEGPSRPRLYRNLGADGFRDVTDEVGLDRAMAPMGCNFGDIDNDGFLDIYLGTGDMSYAGLVPNLMFKNVEGVGFEDVTDVLGHRPPPEGARRLLRRLGLRRRPRPVRRAGRRDARATRRTTPCSRTRATAATG